MEQKLGQKVYSLIKLELFYSIFGYTKYIEEGEEEDKNYFKLL